MASRSKALQTRIRHIIRGNGFLGNRLVGRVPGSRLLGKRLVGRFPGNRFLLLSVLVSLLTQANAVPYAVASTAPEMLAFWHHKKQKQNSENSTGASGTTYDTTGQSTAMPSGSNGAAQPATGLPNSGMPSNTVPPASTGPILVTPSSLIDLSSARFGKVSIDLQGGQFRDTAIDRATLTATELNIGQGSLKGLDIDVLGGRFDQFIFDELSMNTAGDMHFDPNQLLQNKVLQFTVPVRAGVSASVSQESLNKFLADPRTLEKLSVTASKRLGAIASFFGAPNTNIGVILNEAQVNLNKGNKIVISIKANVGMAGVAMPISFDIDAILGIKDGWVNVSDAHLTTNGQEISPQLSEMLVTKINNMASWGHRSDDIQFDFTEIKVVPNKLFSVRGTAMVKRLRMSRAREDAGGTAPHAPPGTGPTNTPNPANPANPVNPVNPGNSAAPGTPSSTGLPTTAPDLNNPPASAGNSTGSSAGAGEALPSGNSAQPSSSMPHDAANPGSDTVSPSPTRLSRPH